MIAKEQAMRSFAFASIACALLVGADAPAARRDQDSLKGDWKQTAFVLNGRARDASGTTVTIDGDSITVRHGDEAESPAPYTLDPAEKAFDLKLENEGRTMKGIYEVAGRTLKICLNPATRPSKFSAEVGTGNVLMVFERL
jgi:uncharacterized protein (TIGR03067 family)